MLLGDAVFMQSRGLESGRHPPVPLTRVQLPGLRASDLGREGGAQQRRVDLGTSNLVKVAQRDLIWLRLTNSAGGCATDLSSFSWRVGFRPLVSFSTES